MTPQFGLVLVWQPVGDNPGFLVVGQLEEPFKVVQESDAATAIDQVDGLVAGDPYPGPADKARGTYKVSQRAGGIIERKVAGGSEIAHVDGSDNTVQVENARKVLAAWESLGRSFSRISVNSLGHAWYEDAAGRKFLGIVEEGFAWPGEVGETNDAGTV